MAKKALITGIYGQDGAYLAKLLLEKDYEVYGGTRYASARDTWRLHELGVAEDVRIMPFDLLEHTHLIRALQRLQPDEIYNLAAQSFVGISFEQPLLTADINAMGTGRVLEAMRTVCPGARFYQASTSEMFGKAAETPQNESTPFFPRSPYGVSKLFAHSLTVNYREAWNLYACSGILFNHESPLRGTDFVTRKITRGLARVRHGLDTVLELGNLDARRDWGFAGDYVRGIWQMLQQEAPDDFVLATGAHHTVRQFAGLAAEAAGFDVAWEGEGKQERGIDRRSGRVVVQVNPEYYRPAEVESLLGDARKAAERLGWSPTTRFEELVEMMARADLDRVAARAHGPAAPVGRG